MKVRNYSNIEISDEEVIEIVRGHVRINLFNRAKHIIVYYDFRVTLVVESDFFFDAVGFIRIGKLAKIEQWGIE